MTINTVSNKVKRAAERRVNYINKFNPLDVTFPSPLKWVKDNVDHINIDFFAESELGRQLYPDSSPGFKHKIFGPFCNIRSFWYYIQSRDHDDSIRKLSGIFLSEFVHKMPRVRVQNFKAIILDSIDQRIKQNEKLLKSFSESTLPFDYYKTNSSGIRIRPEHFKWFLTGLEELRKAIKENREPNLDPFIDDHSVDLYYHLLPKNRKK